MTTFFSSREMIERQREKSIDREKEVATKASLLSLVHPEKENREEND